MKERPILFSAPMVRAILAGKKTQTRRLVKQRVVGPNQHGIFDWYDDADKWLGAHGGQQLRFRGGGPLPFSESSAASMSPYGRPGDRLWVREMWQPIWAEADVRPPHDYASLEGWSIGYPATDGRQEWYDNNNERLTDACKPGIHMPRAFSRIMLEVTGVRVERLQDISGEDARAEGISEPRCDCEPCQRTSAMCPADASVHIESYARLWDAINGKRCPWSSNPWVWVVEFRRAQK